MSTGTGDCNVVVLRGATKLCTCESLLHGCEPVFESAQVRHNDPDVSLNDLGGARRKMKLLLADIRPHITQTDVQVGVQSKAHPHDIEHHRCRLIRHLNVYVLE